MIFQTNLHFISETRCLQRSMRTPTENTWHFALVPQNEYVINGVWIAMDCILSSPCNKFAEQMTLLAQLLSPVTFVYQIVVVNRRKWKRFVTLNFSFKRMTQFISTYSTIHVEWFMNWHISIYIYRKFADFVLTPALIVQHEWRIMANGWWEWLQNCMHSSG